ncbi:MAG: hypothetical protein ABEJ91_02315 [Candidatus Nanohaloarchaea archaeon]
MAKGNLIRDSLLAFLAFFIFMLLIGGTGMTQGDVGKFFAGETAKLKANRIVNAALVLTSMPSGHIEVEMSGKVKLEDGAVVVKKAGTKKKASFGNIVSDYDRYEGPTSFTSVNKKLCVRKTKSDGEEVLHVVPGC